MLQLRDPDELSAPRTRATMLAAGSVLGNGLIVPSVLPPQTQVNVQAMGYAHVLEHASPAGIFPPSESWSLPTSTLLAEKKGRRLFIFVRR